MAPSTPPPPSKPSLAALTMASPANVVMSPMHTRRRCMATIMPRTPEDDRAETEAGRACAERENPRGDGRAGLTEAAEMRLPRRHGPDVPALGDGRVSVPAVWRQADVRPGDGGHGVPVLRLHRGDPTDDDGVHRRARSPRGDPTRPSPARRSDGPGRARGAVPRLWGASDRHPAGGSLCILRVAEGDPPRTPRRGPRARELAPVRDRSTPRDRGVPSMGPLAVVRAERSRQAGTHAGHGRGVPAVLDVRFADDDALYGHARRILLGQRDLPRRARPHADPTGPQDAVVSGGGR